MSKIVSSAKQDWLRQLDAGDDVLTGGSQAMLFRWDNSGTPIIFTFPSIPPPFFLFFLYNISIFLPSLLYAVEACELFAP